LFTAFGVNPLPPIYLGGNSQTSHKILKHMRLLELY